MMPELLKWPQYTPVKQNKGKVNNDVCNKIENRMVGLGYLLWYEIMALSLHQQFSHVNIFILQALIRCEGFTWLPTVGFKNHDLMCWTKYTFFFLFVCSMKNIHNHEIHYHIRWKWKHMAHMSQTNNYNQIWSEIRIFWKSDICFWMWTNEENVYALSIIIIIMLGISLNIRPRLCT